MSVHGVSGIFCRTNEEIRQQRAGSRRMDSGTCVIEIGRIVNDNAEFKLQI